MLEAAFFKNRHVKTKRRLDAPANDVALERVQLVDVVAGQLNEWNALGYLDHIRPRERAEPLEAKVMARRIGAGVRPAQATGVGERMLDRADAPAFLIEHLVVNDAADRQLRIFVDRIILQVFVAAVAVDEMFPIRIFFSDATAKRNRHRGGLDIEYLVVLYDLNRLGDVDVAEAGLNRLEEHSQVQLAEKILALLQVGAVAEAQRKRLEPAKVAAQFAHHSVRRQEHRAAVYPAGETAADRLGFWDALEPFANFIFQRGDVVVANRAEVGGVVVAARIEKAFVRRVGVRAAYELDGHQIMRWNHARVVRMKLIAKSLFLEPLVNSIDAMSDDERRPLDLLCQKVAQRSVERAGQLDRLAVLGDKREGAVEVADGFRRAGEHALARLGAGEIVQLGLVGIGQVNDAFDVLVHDRRLFTSNPKRQPNALGLVGVIVAFAVFVGVGVFRLRFGVNFGDLGFFLKQIDDLGVHDFLLNLVDGTVVLELLCQFLGLDLLLCRHGGDLPAEFLVGDFDAFLFGNF